MSLRRQQAEKRLPARERVRRLDQKPATCLRSSSVSSAGNTISEATSESVVARVSRIPRLNNSGCDDTASAANAKAVLASVNRTARGVLLSRNPRFPAVTVSIVSRARETTWMALATPTPSRNRNHDHVREIERQP